ncbi:UNVERIFIED_CONTAM: hypothetical protein Slati_2697300 [Sesamum latifolium]|uniref:DUF8040 domain-containing protein n=1 Tax=Sesamum latifolium TaxID=2727402 RepID=A0AAW2VVX0_9LAMI
MDVEAQCRKNSQINESSGNTTSSPHCRSNSPHDTGLSWAVGSSGGDEETDSSNMLLYEVLCPSYFWTKQPQHTSSLQGSDWVIELMSGHPDRILNMLRVRKETFQTLCSLLQDKGVLLELQWSRVSVMELLAIFLQTVGLSERQRTSCERFQHSLETISRHMKCVCPALNLLAPELICHTDFNHTHSRI